MAEVTMQSKTSSRRNSLKIFILVFCGSENYLMHLLVIASKQ